MRNRVDRGDITNKEIEKMPDEKREIKPGDKVLLCPNRHEGREGEKYCYIHGLRLVEVTAEESESTKEPTMIIVLFEEPDGSRKGTCECGRVFGAFSIDRGYLFCPDCGRKIFITRPTSSGHFFD